MAAPTKFGESILDAMLDQIRSTSTILRLVHSYTRADNYATVVSNTCAAYAIQSEDIFNATYTDETTLNGADVNAPNRRMAVAAQVLDDATGTNADGTELCLILTSGSEVLAVTDETTDRAVSLGDSITTFPFFVQASQPAQLA